MHKNGAHISIIALIIVFFGAGANTYAFPDDSGTLQKRQWTDSEIGEEIRRYNIRPPASSDERVFLIISGFFEMEGSAPNPHPDYSERVAPVFDRRDEIQQYLMSLPNLEYSELSNSVFLMTVERRADWLCSTSIGCYPFGYVVAVGPIRADRSEEFCKIFRDNQWFCAAKQ
jgi:hypothetical protein